MLSFDVIIIGGGAAGFFTAINSAIKNASLKIAILERGGDVLTKVRVSGGGRCNVTHAVFTPDELIENYPRGGKELLGPFNRFMTGDTMQWFEENGVPLKIEEDGRVFPISDNSQSIIDCFLRLSEQYDITVFKNHSVTGFYKEDNTWVIHTTKATFATVKLVVTTGSNPKIWKLIETLGHRVITPVPSLFTFLINHEVLQNLQGITLAVRISVPGTSLISEGALLITHQGVSGPAVLKLSAWGARYFNEVSYRFSVELNWLPESSAESVLNELKKIRINASKQQVTTHSRLGLPKRLWVSLVKQTGINNTDKWADLSNKILATLTEKIVKTTLFVSGKNTFKEEFVTAGGVDLKEINFKHFESKLHKNLFFAGEVLNIDAVTGGFNFQNAWTGGYCIAQKITE